MIKNKQFLHINKELVLCGLFVICAAIVDVCTYLACTGLFHLSVLGSTVCAGIVSLIFAAIVNNQFVSRKKEKCAVSRLQEAAAFVIALLFDLLTMMFLVEYIHFNDVMIKTASIVFAVLFYDICSFWDVKSLKKGVRSKTTLHTLFDFAPKLFEYLYLIFLGGTLLLILFVDKRKDYFHHDYLHINNLRLYSIVFVFFFISAVFVFFRQRQAQKSLVKKPFIISEKLFYSLIIVTFVLLFAAQYVISKNIYFLTGWDVGVLRDNAWRIINEGIDSIDKTYFGSYPNNLFLLFLYEKIFRGSKLLSINPDMALIVLNLVLVNVSVLLSVLVLYKLTKSKKITVLITAIGAVLVVLSPWITIPYSDTLTMFFPIAVVASSLFIKNKYLSTFLIFFFGIVGYFIKPTVIIVLIAFLILKGITLMKSLVKKEKKHLNIKSGILMIMAVLLAASGGWVVKNTIVPDTSAVLDENRKITMTHFIMMGLNDQTDGVYYFDDVKYSMSLPNVEERQKVNLEVAKQRIKAFGPVGLLKHLAKKDLINYNDGTFFWGGEGGFFDTIIETDSDFANNLRSYFYTHGSHYETFAAVQQTLWLLVLTMCLACVLGVKKSGFTENLIALSILGLSIFLLIFECRSRYLFLYMPLFLVLAGIGMRRFVDFVSSVGNRVKNSAGDRINDEEFQ